MRIRTFLKHRFIELDRKIVLFRAMLHYWEVSVISVFVRYMDKVSRISGILIPLANFPNAQRPNLMEVEGSY